MKRSTHASLLLLTAIVGLTASPCTRGPQAAEKPERPNVLWILAEDICPDLSCYGVEAVDTPNLDQLAADGVRFANAHTTSPVCSTSRSAMMTGMYQNAVGAHQHRTADKRPLPDPVVPFPLLLQRAAYHTGLMHGKKLDLNFEHNGKELFPDGEWTQAGGRPFCIQMSIANTHRSWKNYPEFDVDPADVIVPPYYPDTPLVRRDIANGLEEIQKVDQFVGQVLQRLADDGLAENTLVIFNGDHGRCQVRGKQFLYDSGTHIPLIMRWPGRIKPGTVNEELVSSIDVTASILAATGVGVPEWMHGRDLLGANPSARDYLFTARDKMDSTHDSMRACRDKRFKYILNLMPERAYCQLNEYKERQYPVLALLNVMHLRGELDAIQDRFMQPTKQPEELYDLVNDPFETKNLAADPRHAEDLNRMRAELSAWRAMVGDNGPTDEFRAGGWPGDYPTRTLEEWESRLEAWNQRLLHPDGRPG